MVDATMTEVRFSKKWEYLGPNKEDYAKNQRNPTALTSRGPIDSESR
jgi:hypothetical protein